MRSSKDEWCMNITKVIATRSTCLRRQVGCVLVNDRNHILATGYNGVAAGVPNCNEMEEENVYTGHGDYDIITHHLNVCPGANLPTGQNKNDGCHAIHAEQNALLQCSDAYKIHTAYITVSPCVTCTKLLLNTSCQRIVFMGEFSESKGRQLWEKAGREWIRMVEV